VRAPSPSYYPPKAGTYLYHRPNLIPVSDYFEPIEGWIFARCELIGIVPNKIYETEPQSAKRRREYPGLILQKSTKPDFTSDKICNLPHRPPPFLLSQESRGVDAVFQAVGVRVD